MSQESRRVKVYQLDHSGEWIDKGTGHVNCSQVERNDSVPSIVVKSEEDSSLTLLQSKISREDIYNRQQDTLIVWNEINSDDDNDEGIDLALSFQDPTGCAEIWEEITYIQRSLRSPDIDLDNIILKGGSSDILPIANMNNIDEIHMIINDALNLPKKKNSLAQAILKEKYLQKLIDLWKMVDDLSSKEDCAKMYHIFKDIVLLNDATLLEQIVSDECVYDVLAALEHDPEHGVGQIKHSDFMRNQAKYKEVVPINNPQIELKIHQTYRLQYIKDVALARTLDEPTFNTLNTMIMVNNIETVKKIVENDKVIISILDSMKFPYTSPSTLSDCLQFLIELCELAKNTEARIKIKYYQTLTSNGIFEVLESTLPKEDENLRINSTQLLVYISETDPGLIRSYILKQTPDYKLFSVLVTQIESDSDTCVKNLITDVMRNIFDLNHMEEGMDKVAFLSVFYQRFASVLFAPLMRPLPKGMHSEPESLLKHNLCDLLTYFVQAHGDRISSFLASGKNIVKQVLNILNCKEKFLVLAALRFFRSYIAVENDVYHDYIISENLFEPLIQVFIKNGSKYNLLNSAILELFDTIRRKNMKKLVSHIIKNYWDKVKDVDYCDTFQKLKEQYDKNEYEPTYDDKNNDSMSELLRNRNRKKFLEQQREEAWFEEDDDQDYEPPKDKTNKETKKVVETRGKKRPLSPDRDPSEPNGESPLKKPKIEKG